MEEEEEEMNPEFFKVYLPDQSSSQLTIPQAFVKHFNGVFPQKHMLSVASSNNRTWVVNTKNTNDKFLFDEGWAAFAKDNSLKEGEFLLFTYVGSSNFDVSIYGINGCARSNSTPCNKKIKSESEDESYELNPIKELHNSKAHKTAFSASNGKISSTDAQPPRKKRGRPRGSGKIGRKGSSIREVRTTRKASKYPRFEAVMRSSYLDTGTLSAPVKFMSKYFKPGEHEVKLEVSGKSWPVKLMQYGERSSRFSRGWSRFVKENKLQRHDVCVFALKNAKIRPSFGVTIIRKPK